MEDIQYNKKLVIVGAGGFGREIESWISNSNLNDKYDIVGYLDDNLNKLDDYKTDLKIINNISLQSLTEVGNIVIAISDSNVKKKIFELQKENKSFNILSFFHSTTTLGKYSTIDIGCVATINTIISCNCLIGKGVFINSGSQIGHDVKIGDYCSLMANVDIGGGAIIGDNVFIGTGAVILPGVKICSNVRIGAGSVVLRNIKKEGTYFGNPVKKIF